MRLVIHTINHLSTKNIIVKNQLYKGVISRYYKNKGKTTLDLTQPVNKVCVTCYRVVPKPYLQKLAVNRGSATTYSLK